EGERGTGQDGAPHLSAHRHVYGKVRRPSAAPASMVPVTVAPRISCLSPPHHGSDQTHSSQRSKAPPSTARKTRSLSQRVTNVRAIVWTGRVSSAWAYSVEYPTSRAIAELAADQFAPCPQGIA